MAKKRVPLGPAIQWTEEEIDEFLVVDNDDLQRLRLFWQKHAPSPLRDLIDAQLSQDRATDDIIRS